MPNASAQSSPVRNRVLQCGPVKGQSSVVTEAPIERAEVVALLFNVSDVAATLASIERWLKETMAKRKLTKAEREEMNARHARVLANVERTRGLAERAQAKLDAERSRA
jgi:hypothetical protein